MPLINCEVNLTLTWSSACIITNATGAGRFVITDTKMYVSCFFIDNAKFIQLLKSGFKRTVNWNK